MLSPKDVVNREKALSSECPRWLGSTWNLPDSRFAPWVFFPCVLPVALASHQLVNPWFLPVLLTGIAAGLIGVWRSKGWPQRFLAMDLVATLVLGSAVVYATSLGEPVAFPTALLLAAILALGSVASLVFIERLPNAGVPGGTASENERSRLRWHRALAFVVLVLIVSLVSSARAFGPSPTSVAYTWLVSSSSFGLIWLLSAPCLLDGRFGRLAPTILSLIVLLLFTIWHLASTEVARHQAYPLLWNELLSRSRDDRAW
ncbi:MAG TPA: monovalent cation/H+ antiporter complex subunit F, partial [Vicinamibacteria bacterium]|nr:monovalent cation/H+ antiporter complex subunit F [Vicinamibacteria bacterium]